MFGGLAEAVVLCSVKPVCLHLIDQELGIESATDSSEIVPTESRRARIQT